MLERAQPVGVPSVSPEYRWTDLNGAASRPTCALYRSDDSNAARGSRMAARGALCRWCGADPHDPAAHPLCGPRRPFRVFAWPPPVPYLPLAALAARPTLTVS